MWFHPDTPSDFFFASNGLFFRNRPFKSSYSEIPLPGLDLNEMELQET